MSAPPGGADPPRAPGRAARPALRAVALAAALVVVFGWPAVHSSPYLLALGTSFAVFSVLATGLNLVYGYTGLLSFAQVGFFGIGAYTAALLVNDAGWSTAAAVLAAALLAGLVGWVIGYASLRLSRHAFAIVSLTFALLCMLIARDWVSLTRGSMGIPGLPAPVLGGPGGAAWRVASPLDFYYLLAAYAVIAQAIVWTLVRSRLGRAMQAIRINEPLAQSHGLNPLAYRLLAIVVSAMLAGIAGGFFVFYLTIVDPSIFDFYYTETMLIMVILGGPGSFWGVIASAAVLSAVPDLLRFTTDLRMVLYGAILIAAVLLMPDGVAGWLRRRRRPAALATTREESA